MKRAFTLIELMIVMAVIAILVGIALPRFKGMREEANITKAHGELRALKIAIESYAMHHNDTYPVYSWSPYADYLDADSVSPGPQLIESVLLDPFDTSDPVTEYYYIRGNDGGDPAVGLDYYVIGSKGPDATRDLSDTDVADGVLMADEIGDDIVASNCTLP